MEKVPGIDQVDLKILGLLMSDATMPYTEIAKKSMFQVVQSMFGWQKWKKWELLKAPN
jgi:hypothetical protein